MATTNPAANSSTSSRSNYGRRVALVAGCIGAVTAAAATAFTFAAGQPAPTGHAESPAVVVTQTAVAVSSPAPDPTQATQPSPSATPKSQPTAAVSPTAPAPTQTTVSQAPVSAPTMPTQPAAEPTHSAPQPAQPAPQPTQPAPQPTQPAPQPAQSAPSAAMEPMSQQLFDDMNAQRAASGLAPMRANATLVTIANVRAQDMVDHHYFAHVNPGTGDDVYTLLDRYAVNYTLAGENLATNTLVGAASVQRAFDSMMSSPVHHGHMMSPTYTDIGIAHAVDAEGNSYFVMVFAAF